MQLFKTKQETSLYSQSNQRSGITVGLIPTMGALHEGHLSLLEKAKKNNPITIASIFVNPLQFNNAVDLEKYPRTLERDLQLLENAGCSAVFVPDENEMYDNAPILSMNFGPLETCMEGASRPGHFRGVGIVVSKLFNIVQPNDAYFGQKDLQQFLIIQQLVKDLSFPIKLHCCPILREKDGLAMSSRNVRLTKENRPIAAKINEALLMAASMLKVEGIEKTKLAVISFIANHAPLHLEYFEIVDGNTLSTIIDINAHNSIALCIAVSLDGVRLIDNVVVDN